jgi:hypothetical protein
VGLAEFRQGAGRAGLFMAEAKIFTNDYGSRLQTFDEYLRNKLLGTEARQPIVKRQDEDALGTGVAQKLQALIETTDQFGDALRSDEHGRMWMKSQHCGTNAMFTRVLAGSFEQGLMAAVNAVEIANGEGARAEVAMGGLHGKVNLRTHAPNRPTGISKPS